MEIIRRVGGRASDLKVTFSSQDDRPVLAFGSVGLRMRFGTAPEHLVADIREVARVCQDEEPHPALAFIDYIQPVVDRRSIEQLDLDLDDLLGRPQAEEHVVPVVPVSALDRLPEARSFSVQIGGARPSAYPSLEAEHILRRTRLQRSGDRMNKLRTGWVHMYSDDDGRNVLAKSHAVKWVEASLSRGSQRFFLMDGDWYEIGAEYIRTSREEIADLFASEPTLDLPPWYLTRGHHERDYNAYVPLVREDYLCLDRNQEVRNPLEPRNNTLEICDLLGPGNELIHAKRAKGSEPLSHLFYQGLVSALTLITGPSEAREQFAKAVRDLPGGRALAPDFKPRKVVYAILLKDGQQLTLDTLFPFSQVSLAHAARTLRGYGIEVEVIGIPAA